MGLDKSETKFVAQVAQLAQGLLVRRGNLSGNGFSLADRLFAAGIDNLTALDGFIYGDRRVAREKLGLRTLNEADRILSALGRALRETKEFRQVKLP